MGMFSKRHRNAIAHTLGLYGSDIDTVRAFSAMLCEDDPAAFKIEQFLEAVQRGKNSRPTALEAWTSARGDECATLAMPVDPTTGPRMISRYLRDHEHEIKSRLLCEGAAVPARHGISYSEAMARDQVVWDWLEGQARAQPAYVRWECRYTLENTQSWERAEARRQKRLARWRARRGD